MGHVEHLAKLVGVEHIGLGSDFDGIDRTVSGLAHAGEAQNLLEALRTRFSDEEVYGIASQNFRRYVKATTR